MSSCILKPAPNCAPAPGNQTVGRVPRSSLHSRAAAVSSALGYLYTHPTHSTPHRSVRFTMNRNSVCSWKGPEKFPGKPIHSTDEAAEVCHNKASDLPQTEQSVNSITEIRSQVFGLSDFQSGHHYREGIRHTQHEKMTQHLMCMVWRMASSELLLHSNRHHSRLQKATRDGSAAQEGGRVTSVHKEPSAEDSAAGSSEVPTLSQKLKLSQRLDIFNSSIDVKLAQNKPHLFSVSP